eukprot:c6084_g1_i2.p1 GENE.c6084_g1_i2~~c6084_g1_i2.p1  ORF type:complete len:141 (-),score=36.95 c6084_g1_i2:111-533(-)
MIVAHELGHFLARHPAEEMTLSGVLMALRQLIYILFPLPYIETIEPISRFAFKLPRSRHLESEADFIALKLMARACFDPRCASTVLSKFGHAENEWFSTHPSSDHRAHMVSEWMPSAVQTYRSSKCPSQVNGFFSRFVKK